ncbi:hypothetical protein BDQ17DRAFT_1326009 [Cyathus striatus]|nr:hypothetical protein BDQ17DRAFT_1326009 [Cyathus striatus]
MSAHQIRLSQLSLILIYSRTIDVHLSSYLNNGLSVQKMIKSSRCCLAPGQSKRSFSWAVKSFSTSQAADIARSASATQFANIEYPIASEVSVYSNMMWSSSSMKSLGDSAMPGDRSTANKAFESYLEELNEYCKKESKSRENPGKRYLLNVHEHIKNAPQAKHLMETPPILAKMSQMNDVHLAHPKVIQTQKNIKLYANDFNAVHR